MKICIVQTYPKLDVKNNINRAENFIKNASKHNCDIIVFPELFLTGYIFDDRLKEIALDVNSIELKTIQNIPKTTSNKA